MKTLLDDLIMEHSN